MKESVQPHAVAAVPLGKELPLSIEHEVGWVSELVWMCWRRETSLAIAGIHTPDHKALSLYWLHYHISET